MVIREATADDWPALWHIIRPIIEAGETYALDPAMDEEGARRYWLLGEGVRTTVAELDGEIAGTANGYANRQGNGSHVASGSFMVDADKSGKGVGRALGEDLIAWAREAGFRSIQFNAVVETNAPAVALWKSLGFEIVGTVPGAFEHPSEGFVGLHIMYLEL
ncbi:MAG TPA: GNAT family N-acetyltransferase [Solirubrobacterales bacterium]|nr:GNAT family N-acetyltransferase [Solirubrobacterales bacterium]